MDMNYTLELIDEAKIFLELYRDMLSPFSLDDNDRKSVHYHVVIEETDELVDIYYLNREYEDFIELLKYFVSVQDSRPELVYIRVLSNGTYQIFDKNKNDITKKCLYEFSTADDMNDVSFDDLLISILITLAPEKMIVENSKNIKNVQLFETIERVFENVVYKK